MNMRHIVRNPYLVVGLMAFLVFNTSVLNAETKPTKQLAPKSMIPSFLVSNKLVSAAVSTTTMTVSMATSATVSGPVAFIPPQPMTTEFFTASQHSELLNHPLLNKITDLLNLVEWEGLEKSWYLSEANVAHFNELVIQKNNKALAKDVKRAVQRIASDFYGGRVRPAQLVTQYKVVSKRLQSHNTFDIERYLKNEISAEELLNELRPKNKYYLGLVNQYKKFKLGHRSNYFPVGPDTITVIKPATKDAAAVMMVRYRLEVLGYKNDIANPKYSSDLRKAILAFQANHSLGVDGTVGPMGWKILNFNIDTLLARLIINIDHTRWLPDDMGYEYIHVNLATQKLRYFMGEELLLDFNVIAGSVERPSPILFDSISHFILNPTWIVPQSILIKDKLKLFKANPGKVIDMNMKIVDKKTYLDVDPYTVNWEEISETNYPYHFIQNPGAHNALGFIKFPMTNGYSIYMHDTDARFKLNENFRLLSSGCIRLQRPFDLAEKLLNDPAITAVQLKEMTELLPEPAVSPTQIEIGRNVPVYILYSTTSLSPTEEMIISNDHYGLDLMTFNIMSQAL